MFDFRYHLVSIVAVFLALAIGIMLGTSIENRGYLKKQQQRLIKSIEEDISQIKNKNVGLQNQLQAQKAFEAEILPVLTKNKLVNQKVGLIYYKDAGSNTLRAAAFEALNQAGAKVQELPLDRNTLLKIKLPDQIASNDTSGKYRNLDQLSVELSTGVGPLLEHMQENKQLVIDQNELPINSIVLFAGGDKPSLEEIALVKALRKNKIKTVFVDKSDNKNSKVDQFIDANVDTVDNIEMVYGRISLVYVLLESRRGHYGVRSSAEQLMPALN